MNAEDRFVAVATLDRSALRRMFRWWSRLGVGDLQGSFQGEVLPGMLGEMITAQEEAASIGAEFVASARPAGAATVVPSAFAGIASDGRDLASLLSQPLIQVFTGLARGVPAQAALRGGSDVLDRIVTTQVQDAARQAESVGMVAHRDISGYVRTVEPGACSRCVVLAGRFYKWNEGFDRHPACRCSHSPLTRLVEPQSPLELFNAMPAAVQEKTFTAAGAQAIRDGADVGQVVNARRGMSTATVGGQRVAVTNEGTGKRGYYAAVRQEIDSQRGGGTTFVKGKTKYRRVERPRLLPEEIMRQAGPDRVEARRLLISNGYVIGDIKKLAIDVAR